MIQRTYLGYWSRRSRSYVFVSHQPTLSRVGDTQGRCLVGEATPFTDVGRRKSRWENPRRQRPSTSVKGSFRRYLFSPSVELICADHRVNAWRHVLGPRSNPGFDRHREIWVSGGVKGVEGFRRPTKQCWRKLLKKNCISYTDFKTKILSKTCSSKPDPFQA